jgi:hypothetical protein
MKLFFATAVLALTTLNSWSQGTVTFQNGGLTFPTIANRYVYASGPIGPGDGSDAARRLTGTNYCAGLWYVPGSHSDQMAGGRGGMQAMNSIATSSSVFNFRSPTTADVNKGTWVVVGGNSFVLNILPGETATLQVRVWDYVAFGRTEAGYLAALTSGGNVCYSMPFDYTMPQPGSTPDKYYMNNLRAFTGVPEPSTLALGALGMACLLFARRGKK